MKTLIVKLWGDEIGRLVWLPAERLVQFVFNPELKERPDFAPLLCPLGKWSELVPVTGNSDRLYQGLPPFVADSLPDSWGNALFEQWVKRNRIPRRDVTPLFKLAFIGRRGMGALEFEPSARELEHPHAVRLRELYALSLKIADERSAVSITEGETLSFESLIAAGTSAGGRQMKSIIAINPTSGEIRSGQLGGLRDFDYWLIKFEAADAPVAEIEMAYYEMALGAGIMMEESKLLDLDGVNHFLMRRFDRHDGEKVHMQTLAAINPEAKSYDEMFATARKLDLEETEMKELFRRMVFNILSNNTDDHTKNFSFLLDKGGKWRLSPAYDLTFIFNRFATGPETGQSMSVGGKFRDITREDIMEFARENGIKCAKSIIEKTGEALKGFPRLAEKYNIPHKWRDIIHTTLSSNLIAFGFKEELPNEFTTPDLKVSGIRIVRNQKGLYEMRGIVNGIPRRQFVSPEDTLYSSIVRYSAGELTAEEAAELFREAFG